MKQIVKDYVIWILLNSVLMFFLPFSIMMALKEFDIIDVADVLVITCGIALLLGICKTGYDKLLDEHNSIKQWGSKNSNQIFISSIVLTLFFLSMKNDVMWTNEEAKEVIGIEWTILSISIAVFLFWHVVFSGYLKEAKPVFKEDYSLWEAYNYLKNKKEFSDSITIRFNGVIYLTINMILLFLVSYSVYVLKLGENLGIQTFILLCLYFSTNTLLLLFSDLLSPIVEEKKKLHKENQMTQSDKDLGEALSKYMSKIYDDLKKIENDDTLDEKTKTERVAAIMDPFIRKRNNGKKD